MPRAYFPPSHGLANVAGCFYLWLFTEMNLKHLVIILLLISTPGVAKNEDWLGQYMRSKSFKCDLNEDQFKKQITKQLDQNIEKLKEALKVRGSDFESIQEQRDSVDIGIFLTSRVYDFYVLENVSVMIQGYQFPIQTTYFMDNEPSVENGLWLPFVVKDPGRDEVCQLQRISMRDGQQLRRPEVNLVFGRPPRVIAPRLIEVVDDSSSQAAEPAPAVPLPPPSPMPEKADSKVEEHSRSREPSERRSRRERRERHRRERRHSRHRKRYHYRRHIRLEQPQPPNPCAGELSAWMKIKCAVTGDQ